MSSSEKRLDKSAKKEKDLSALKVIDREVKLFIARYRNKGTPINSSMIRARAESIARKYGVYTRLMNNLHYLERFDFMDPASTSETSDVQATRHSTHSQVSVPAPDPIPDPQVCTEDFTDRRRIVLPSLRQHIDPQCNLHLKRVIKFADQHLLNVLLTIEEINRLFYFLPDDRKDQMKNFKNDMIDISIEFANNSMQKLINTQNLNIRLMINLSGDCLKQLINLSEDLFHQYIQLAKTLQLNVVKAKDQHSS